MEGSHNPRAIKAAAWRQRRDEIKAIKEGSAFAVLLQLRYDRPEGDIKINARALEKKTEWRFCQVRA